MSDQHTNVTYNAVSNFTNLDNDLDRLLAKIQALKKAEKDLNKAQRERQGGGPKSSSGTSSNAATSRSAEANEKRRIARLDAAQRMVAARDLRHQKSLDQALNRRNRSALQNQRTLAAQENRQERSKNEAQRRRSRRADQDLKNSIASENRKQRSLDRAQDRRNKKENEALAERLRREKHESDLVRRAEKAQFAEDVKDEASAAQIQRRLDAASARDIERTKDEASKERIRQERNAARDVEAADKKRAEELRRDLALARQQLSSVNQEASDGNVFTRRKIQPRSVGPVEVKYDSDKDANYYQAVSRAREEELRLIERSTQAVNREMDARGGLYNILRKIPAASREAGTSTSGSFRGAQRDIRNTNGLLQNFSRNLDAIGRWRPRLIPPFIALVPIIAALLGLINPLVAGLGALSSVVIGLAGNIGSLAGAALGAIPALASLLSLGAALKMTFGGVGKALKAAGKANGGAGGSGSGSGRKTAEPELEEITRTEKIQRAQERYRRSIEDVADATKNLDDAKKDYLKRLKDIEKQVERIRQSEQRAAANAQLAQEEYWNVMADSGSTKGQKMDALVNLDESRNELQDVKKEAKDLRAELKDLRSGGMSSDPSVRNATRALTDAIWAQRDAQIDLANAYKDTGKAAEEAAGSNGSGGVDEFAEAMAKLSPSAQAVVLALLAMQPAWEAVKRSVQESFFREIVDDIQLLVRLFPVLENLLGKSAAAFGRVSSRALRLVTSDKWLKDLNILAEQNVPLIENVGDGLLHVLSALKDLAIAAGPFSVAMSQGFADGAKNFETMVSNARETGSLADWLETVRQRLEQWWRIVKNVGATLFNYGAAASEFGDWLTDGLEKTTEGWRKASEEARKEDSPFKVWLEDVKPALSAVKEMFATFFEWFGREASNKENIEAFTRIVDTLTNELGPALARIFDALSEKKVGESLLDAIVTILEAIATFLENGGAEGIKQFFDTVNDLFRKFADVLEDTDPEVIKGIAGALATISALRFFGITKLIGWLVTLATGGKIGKLMSLFASMKKVDKTNFPIGAGGSGGTAKNGGFWGKLGKGAKGIGKGLKAGGPLGLALSALVGMGVDSAPVLTNAVNGTYTKDPKQGQKDMLALQSKWAMPGVGLGIDVIGMFFPNAQKDIENWMRGVTDSIVEWIHDIPNKIIELNINIFQGLLGFKDWLVEQWNNAVDYIKGTPERMAREAGVIWGLLQNFHDWLVEKWEDAGVWLSELPGRIASTVASAAGTVWGLLQNFNEWLVEKWVAASTWLASLPGKVKAQIKNLWTQLQSFGGWLKAKWVTASTWLTGLPEKIKTAVGDVWEKLPSLAGWLTKQAKNIPKNIGETFADIFGNLGNSFSEGEGSVRPKNKNSRGAGGGGGAGGAVFSAANIKSLPPIQQSGKNSGQKSIWSVLFGDPLAWLNEKWADIPAWFVQKGEEVLAPVRTVGNIMRILWNATWVSVVSSFNVAYANIARIWRSVSNTLSSIWRTGIKPVIDTLTRVVKTDPVRAFEAARDAIGRAWAGIIDKAKRPVRFVVNVVLGGLIKAVNKIPGVNVAKPQLPEGFHDGGYTGNKPARQAVGVVHGDEHVIRANSRRRIERSNPGLLDHMNTYGEVPGYRKGGLVNPLPGGSYSVSQPYHAGHNGIDLAAPTGTKVYATGSGVVQLAGVVPMGGNEVYIQHDNGLGTRYSHLSRFASRPGDRVRAGNIIGYVGSTGNSTGPHLHYMVHNPGRGPNSYYPNTNPAGWMNGNAQDLGEASNPLTGLVDFVTSSITKHFPKGDMWVNAASGIAKEAAKQVVSKYTPKIGVDNNGHTLYDTGGYLQRGRTVVQNNTGKKEAILTNPQWQSMYEVHDMLATAFSGLNRMQTSSPALSMSGTIPTTGIAGSSIDKRVVIEKMEINNPVGETTDQSIANTLRDLTYLRG